jgi:transposase-like protein
MHRTRTSLLKWFWAIFLVSHDKRGVSAEQLMADLELSNYVAYLMLHKICKAMGDRDQNYQLGGLVELDEAYFGAPSEGGKRGRGTDKTPVLVGLSLDKSGRPKYVKMSVISDVKGETLAKFAKENIVPGSTISSDALASYNKLAEKGFIHEPVKFNAKDNPDHLKWLHTFIGNAKAFIGGTYHA